MSGGWPDFEAAHALRERAVSVNSPQKERPAATAAKQTQEVLWEPVAMTGSRRGARASPRARTTQSPASRRAATGCGGRC